MAKSKIIKDLIEGQINESQAIERLYLIASELNFVKVQEWCKSELSGYRTDQDLPVYRQIGLGVVKYSGVTGNWKLSKANLQMEVLLDKFDELNEIAVVRESISFICNAVDSNSFQINLSWLISYIYKQTGIQCLELYMEYSMGVMEKIITSVRLRLIDSLTLLEKQFGNIDVYDLDYENKNEEEKDTLEKGLENVLYSNNAPL